MPMVNHGLLRDTCAVKLPPLLHPNHGSPQGRLYGVARIVDCNEVTIRESVMQFYEHTNLYREELYVSLEYRQILNHWYGR